MKTIENWNEVEAVQDTKKLSSGAYICVITNVVDFPDKEYLKVEYDVYEGEFKGYFKERYIANNRQFWSGVTFKSYSQKGLSFFKAFIEAVEDSNHGYRWNWIESTLRGKIVGFVLGEEEYQATDGKIKKRLYVHKILPVSKVREGNYKVPELKSYVKKDEQTAAAPTGSLRPVSNNDDNLPF